MNLSPADHHRETLSLTHISIVYTRQLDSSVEVNKVGVYVGYHKCVTSQYLHTHVCILIVMAQKQTA